MLRGSAEDDKAGTLEIKLAVYAESAPETVNYRNHSRRAEERFRFLIMGTDRRIVAVRPGFPRPRVCKLRTRDAARECLITRPIELSFFSVNSSSGYSVVRLNKRGGFEMI